jgi:hypothetical protein
VLRFVPGGDRFILDILDLFDETSVCEPVGLTFSDETRAEALQAEHELKLYR